MNDHRTGWRVLAAVQFLDSFDGRPVSLSFLRFQTVRGIRVIKKEDGIAVFASDLRRTAAECPGLVLPGGTW